MLNRLLNILLINLFSFLFILLPNCLHAENLLEVYLLAVKYDPIVLAAQQNQLAEREQLVIARSKMLPNVSFNGSQNYAQATDKLYGLQNRKYNYKNYTLNIAQPIFEVVNWMNYGAVKKQTLAALKKYEDTEQKLILRVAEQYFATLVAVDQLETSRAVKQAFAKRLEQANRQFKLGLTAITDINEAQAKLDNASAKLINDENALKTAKEGLNQIVGKFIDDIIPLKQEIPLVPPDPLLLDPWLEKARKNNIKLQAIRLDAEAARENIRVASSRHLPTINANGSISKSKTPPPGPNKRFVREIAVGLEVPIFSGGSTVANAEAAIFKANAAFQQLESVYRDVESNTRIAYNSILTQISQVDALSQSVNSSKVALKATQKAFEVGTRTIVDVLNSQSDLLNTQKDYAKAKYDYIMNCLKLKQVTGALSVVDLEQINNLLEIN